MKCIGTQSYPIFLQNILQVVGEHFTPRKPLGRVLRMTDGHSSHQGCLEMLDFAVANGIILLCLSSHTTQGLQTLDSSFSKPFKILWKKETQQLVNHRTTKILKKDMFDAYMDAKNVYTV